MWVHWDRGPFATSSQIKLNKSHQYIDEILVGLWSDLFGGLNVVVFD
jgi:hypothetical protein